MSDNEFSYGAFGGYRFSQSFAVEGSLVTTTDFEDILDALLNSSTRAEYAVQTVRALGIVQRNKWELFGGLGYHQSDADERLDLSNVAFGWVVRF